MSILNGTSHCGLSFFLLLSFMSMELAGCPKNSRRWTRVVAAPKFSAKKSCSDDT